MWSVAEPLCLKILLYIIHTGILSVVSRLKFEKKAHILNMQVKYTGLIECKFSNSVIELKFSGNYFEKVLNGVKIANINSFL